MTVTVERVTSLSDGRDEPLDLGEGPVAHAQLVLDRLQRLHRLRAVRVQQRLQERRRLHHIIHGIIALVRYQSQEGADLENYKSLFSLTDLWLPGN